MSSDERAEHADTQIMPTPAVRQAPGPHGVPGFPVVVRGYDRAQVDEYLVRLHRWVEDAQEQMAAEQRRLAASGTEIAALRRRVRDLEESAGTPVPGSMHAFGERLSAILESALQAAEELRGKAAEEADAIREAATRDRDAAHAQVQADVEQILEQARAQERAIAQQVAELATRRAAALEELGRLQQHLAAFLGEPGTTAAGASDAPPAPAGAPAGAGQLGGDGEAEHLM